MGRAVLHLLASSPIIRREIESSINKILAQLWNFRRYQWGFGSVRFRWVGYVQSIQTRGNFWTAPERRKRILLSPINIADSHRFSWLENEYKISQTGLLRVYLHYFLTWRRKRRWRDLWLEARHVSPSYPTVTTTGLRPNLLCFRPKEPEWCRRKWMLILQRPAWVLMLQRAQEWWYRRMVRRGSRSRR